MIGRILDCVFGTREKVEHRTIDGGHLAPYPNMTDYDLWDYEMTFNVPNPTFKEAPQDVRYFGEE